MVWSAQTVFTRGVIALVLAVGSLAALGGAPAQAYTHTWSCPDGRTAGAHCTDYTGTLQNPWHAMSAHGGVYDDDSFYTYWCASGTRSGGVWNFACGYGTNVSGSRCDAGDTIAYTYHLVYQGLVATWGTANTTGGC
jgi:hypothetical protein